MPSGAVRLQQAAIARWAVRRARRRGRGEGAKEAQVPLPARLRPFLLTEESGKKSGTYSEAYHVGGDLSETIVRVAAPPNQRLTLTARVTTLDIIGEPRRALSGGARGRPLVANSAPSRH
ncbi:Protein of unknown function, partial [Gryllus bimaculatus]